jgi:quercetin dioxygenase-like cupin family protein
VRLVELTTLELADFGSRGVAMAAVPATPEAGEFRVHIAGIEAGGTLGRHPAQTWQLFVVVLGSCRLAADGAEPVEVLPGHAALLAPGEEHQSWADTDVVALIIQSTEQPDVDGLEPG